MTNDQGWMTKEEEFSDIGHRDFAIVLIRDPARLKIRAIPPIINVERARRGS